MGSDVGLDVELELPDDELELPVLPELLGGGLPGGDGEGPGEAGGVPGEAGGLPGLAGGGEAGGGGGEPPVDQPSVLLQVSHVTLLSVILVVFEQAGELAKLQFGDRKSTRLNSSHRL